jgi:hypothetical protein
VRDDLALLGAEPVHDAGDAVRVEQPHQIVFQRQEELRCTRIALAAGPAAQLPVDPPRLVALRTDDVQAAILQSMSSPCQEISVARAGSGTFAAELRSTPFSWQPAHVRAVVRRSPA